MLVRLDNDRFFKGDDLSKKKMDCRRDGARYERWEREYRRKGKG